VKTALTIIVALAGVGLLAFLFHTPRFPDLRSRGKPARSYDEAIQRIAALQAAEGETTQATCRSFLLTHGGATPRVDVLLHGLTNCPEQFRALAKRLYDRGDNVFVPRIPHHGLADLMTRDLANLRADELIQFTDEVTDIAQGLGERVTVVGLSLGGVQAAWAAAERSDVDRAVVIAPLFGVGLLPAWLTTPLANVWLALPNQFVWWDPRYREKPPGPPYVYPRYSTRAVGETLRLGLAIEKASRGTRPLARSVVFLLNPRDKAVNNGEIRALVRRWEKSGATNAEVVELPSSLNIGHDIIDPLQPYQNVEVVYPIVEKLIGG